MNLLMKLVFICASISFAAPALAVDFQCTPTEVAVYTSRIHVRCSAGAKDGSANIWFWAVSTADAQRANRFMSTATTALVAGRNIRLSFNAGDTSGTSFGCLAKDCRTPWAITIY